MLAAAGLGIPNAMPTGVIFTEVVESNKVDWLPFNWRPCDSFCDLLIKVKCDSMQ